MQKPIKTIKNLLAAGLILFAASAYAYETAPRITDREIVESLAELKQGQKNLNRRIDDLISNFDKRFEQMDKRLESIDDRFESIDNRFESIDNRFESIDNRFESIDKRFESFQNVMNNRFESMQNMMNSRFESMQNMVVALIVSVLGLIAALFGYMVWDRKTMQQPFRARINRLEQECEAIDGQLEMRNPSGPVMERVLAAFRKLAETDEKVAAILKSYSLL